MKRHGGIMNGYLKVKEAIRKGYTLYGSKYMTF
jgi:hypothetical protein